MPLYVNGLPASNETLDTLRSSFANLGISTKVWDNPTAGFTQGITIGETYEALSPGGYNASDTGRAVQAGERRTFQRTSTSTWVDLGDSKAVVLMSKISNVDNTSDMDKPISDAVQAELDALATSALDGKFVPDRYGTRSANDTALVQAALAAAVAAGRGEVVLIAGEYKISAPIQLVNNVSLTLSAGAILSAADDFVGEALVIVGTTSTFARNLYIGGGGTINCNTKCDAGIAIKQGQQVHVEDLFILNPIKDGVRIGDVANGAAAYEIHLRNVQPAAKDETNHAESVGFNFINCTDSVAAGGKIRGFRKGVYVGSPCGNIILDQLHPWARPAHGAMTHGFHNDGFRTILRDCYADTPFDLLGLGGDLFGYFMHGFNAVLDGCAVFMNLAYPGTDISTDSRVYPLYWDRETNSLIDQFAVTGGSASKRFKDFYGAPVSTYGEQTFIGPFNDSGATFYASTTNRKMNVPALSSYFWGRQYLNGGLSCYQDALFTRAINQADANSRPRGKYTQSSGFINRWFEGVPITSEPGSNQGSPWQLNSYDDTGAALKTLIDADRRGGMKMPTGFGMTPLTAAPPNLHVGLLALADQVTWDPLSRGSGGGYWVWWTGSAWRGLHEDASGGNLG